GRPDGVLVLERIELEGVGVDVAAQLLARQRRQRPDLLGRAGLKRVDLERHALGPDPSRPGTGLVGGAADPRLHVLADEREHLRAVGERHAPGQVDTGKSGGGHARERYAVWGAGPAAVGAAASAKVTWSPSTSGSSGSPHTGRPSIATAISGVSSRPAAIAAAASVARRPGRPPWSPARASVPTRAIVTCAPGRERTWA